MGGFSHLKSKEGAECTCISASVLLQPIDLVDVNFSEIKSSNPSLPSGVKVKKISLNLHSGGLFLFYAKTQKSDVLVWGGTGAEDVKGKSFPLGTIASVLQELPGDI